MNPHGQRCARVPLSKGKDRRESGSLRALECQGDLDPHLLFSSEVASKPVPDTALREEVGVFSEWLILSKQVERALAFGPDHEGG
jgi:hypothetical protein